MDIVLQPGPLTGEVQIPASKSIAHRFLICAALADRSVHIRCAAVSEDMEATCQCLQAMGAGITRTENGYHVTPISHPPHCATLPCKESGATLRMLLPVAGALGMDATFLMEGRLPQRPLSPLWEELDRMGCRLSRPTANTVRIQGKLRPGRYSLSADISSQFVSGLLLAMPLLGEGSFLEIQGEPASAPYIAMTRRAIGLFAPHAPEDISVERDWSGAAFWYAANALGSNISMPGLTRPSVQGDSAITDLLPQLQKHCSVSAADIPDLIPVLSVVAAANCGAVFTDIHRLRLKESDRVASILEMLHALGGRAEADGNTLTVYPSRLSGGIVDSYHDHRIAMAAAIAATVCTQTVTILHAECVRKSYPDFWEQFHSLHPLQ